MRDTLTLIGLAGSAAPSADNSQPWDFSGNESGISIHYPTLRLASSNTFGEDEPPTLVAVGAAIENMTQATTAFGGSASWHAAAGASSGSFYGRLALSNLPHGEADPGRIAFILDRHTNRNPFRQQQIDPKVLQALPQNCGSIRLSVVTDATVKSRIANLLRQSGELRFQTPELFAMLSDSLRYGAAEVMRGDGLDVRTLCLPPGGARFLKIAAKPRVLRMLNCMRVHKVLARIDAQPVAQAPALLILSGPSDRSNLIEAGRLLERTWILLNAAGLAVHPYYALSDQLHRYQTHRIAAPLLPQATKLAAQARDVLDLGPQEWPQIILRVGYPVRAARRSRRLPAATVWRDQAPAQ